MKRILTGACAAMLVAGCTHGPPMAPAMPEPAEWGARQLEWTDADTEYLARVLVAEARGEVAKYPQSVVAVGYVIARTARKHKVGVKTLITKTQPWLLTSYKEGPRGINGKYFHLPTHKIENFAQFEAIARKALAFQDPTGIDPNHFYDDSIAHRPPAWSKGPGVKKKQIGHFIFVHNPKDA